MERLIPYRYNTYTDTLVAIGSAVLIKNLYTISERDIILRATPSGFIIRYPDNEHISDRNPFIQIKDKPTRQISQHVGPGQLWDKTSVEKGEPTEWWGTVSVINTLASPDFNNGFYNAYSSNLAESLLNGEKVSSKGSRSQLLYAQASKGVNSERLTTTQGNIKADAEQTIAHLGYLYGAAGFIRDSYTISIVPRPSLEGDISLEDYRSLVSFLRAFQPRASSEKILPAGDQTLPFFLSMMYFDFVEQLFNYLPTNSESSPYIRQRHNGVGRVIGGLDRMIYYKMGTGSAPFVADSIGIPVWLNRKSAAANIRDVVRGTLGENIDPNLLYLPVRTFAEGEPRLLLAFYRQYVSLSNKKRLLEQKTIQHIMEQTQYDDLASDAMKRFARAIRSRTLTKLYRDGEQPDFALLTKLKSASLDSKRFINMLSEFIGSYNLRNARLMAIDKAPEGSNLSYEDLQEIIPLIDKYGSEFVANTLMAQAMSKRPDTSDENVTQ